MSQKLLVFLIGLLLVSALGSYVYYRRSVARVPVDAWALVPDDAVFVMATRDHPTLMRHLKETQLWDNLTAVRYFQQVEDNLTLADSVAGARNVVLRFLGRKKVLTSVHVTGPASFDVLFQVPIGSVREYRQVRTLVDGLRRDARYRVSSRDYHGQELTDVREKGTGHGLTYFNYRNHLIMSANGALVEAVVQRLDHPGLPSVAADFQNTDFFQLKDVDATLLINYRRMPQFLGLFFRSEIGAGLAGVTSLARNGQFEMKLAGNKVVFNGFANPETARGSLHQRLRGQLARRLRMADVLSVRTAVLVHLGQGPVAGLREVRRPLPAADSLTAGTGPLVDSLAAGLAQEAALCYLASPSARSRPAKLALAYCLNPLQTATWLGQLRRQTGASPGFERVGPYQIYQAGLPELPARLLGPLFRGFAAPAVAMVGSYLVVGDEAADLRQYLTDVVAGEVWSRSPTQVAFLQETQPLARLSIFLDTRNSWNVLLRALVEERRAGLLRNETLFKRFPQVALQFVPAANETDSDAQYYTQLVLRHPALGPAVARPQTPNGTGGTLTFKTRLISSPALVAVAGAARPGTLVQDGSNVLHYVTPDNVVSWSDSLPGPLVEPVQRLAAPAGHLFATANRLHLLDEQGREAANFPLNLPDTVQVSSLTVSPAGARGAARLLVAGGGGNLFLYDAAGNAYPGWQPKRMEFALAAPPHYLVVGGRDVVVVPLENGYIYAFDQQGSVYPGFPISVGARLHTGAFVESSATLSRSRLTVVTQHGERVTFNLSGDIVSRSRVATWSRGSVFRLIPDQRQRTYVVTREEGGRLSLFEPSGRLLLTQTFVTSGPKITQFFNLGPGRRAFVITEPGPHKAYLFDDQGRLAGGQPFDSSAPQVGLLYDAATSSYELHRVVGNELRRTLLKFN
ncbi:hypothetical protein SAMN02745146_1590 [Hymenobacter daecheongensis DSM 21074]|uniref:Outer membrane protein assembly factor BamB, contains PQQ-like beta-propeller repeat n=1 Tax=Hymenobacter daecheongensis DSM 21074 TaxID=1121955 RepID=A0A1M6E7Y2_9BACT|nr:hypothetical protein [Hymenobacter daecheongensis]SHI81460.1 hypothetical protein SAMN02745146_1590 [Hymenobacter daecheongensis DSM 21074]